MKFLEFSLIKSVYSNMEAFRVHVILFQYFSKQSGKTKKKNTENLFLIKKMYNLNLMHPLK